MREIWGKYRPEMNLADLHIHTTASRDARDGMTPDQAVELAERIGITTIAITDHDALYPSISAWDTAQRKNSPLQVVPGMEITSLDGHIIALFLKESISSKMPARETIQAIHAQGGLAILPHPEFAMIGSVGRKKIIELLQEQYPFSRPDGMEVFNGGVFDYAMRKALSSRTPTTANEEAYLLYHEHGSDIGAPIAASDAHRKTMGRFVTGYEGNLYDAISYKRTVALARSMDDVRGIVQASSEMFGTSFDSSRINAWIDLITQREDEYFSYLGR